MNTEFQIQGVFILMLVLSLLNFVQLAVKFTSIIILSFRNQLQKGVGRNERKNASDMSRSKEKDNVGFHVKPLEAPYRSQVFDNHRGPRGAVRPPVYMIDSEIRNNAPSSANLMRSNRIQNRLQEQNNPKANDTEGMS